MTIDLININPNVSIGEINPFSPVIVGGVSPPDPIYLHILVIFILIMIVFSALLVLKARNQEKVNVEETEEELEND